MDFKEMGRAMFSIEDHLKEQKVDAGLIEDLRQFRGKYEVAEELGLLPKVLEEGWKSLSSKETGKIGGMVNQRKKKL